MFNAPSIITQIPDIAQIYEINEEQSEELENAIDDTDLQLFVNSMAESTLISWEKIYHIEVLDSDTLDDRRTKVKAKMLEHLPYSYRVVIKKLNVLCPDGYELTLDENLTEFSIKIVLSSKKMISNVQAYLEETVPLNMLLDVDLLYNTYQILKRFTHEHLEDYTYQQLRDEVIS